MTRQSRGDARTAVVVSGMPGGGSGPLTDVLRTMGATAPATTTASAAPDPSTAADPVAELNELVLARFGSWAAGWDTIDPHALGSAVRLVTRARRAVRDAAEDSQVLVLDDPRMSRLLPLWTRALEQEGFQCRHVLAVPHPRALVRSLGRQGLNRKSAVLSWLAHTLDAERHTRHHPRVVVSLEDFSHDWRTQLDRISESLDVTWPRTPDSIADEVGEALRGSRAPDNPGAAGRGAVATVSPVHDILRQWRERPPRPEEEAALDEWRRALEPVRRHRSATAHVASEHRELVIDLQERGLRPGRLATTGAWRPIFSEGHNLEAGAAWSWLVREREALGTAPPTVHPDSNGLGRADVTRTVRSTAGRLRRGVARRVRSLRRNVAEKRG